MKEPRWVVPFLRALERTGDVRAAAKDAGVDHSTAYARRRAHAEFAAAWAEALERGRAERKRAEDEEIAALKAGNTPPPAPLVPLRTGFAGREELTVAGGKVRRAGRGRWSKAKEKIFFETLAATASLRMAADAIGMSTNAILARRQKSRLFATKFDVVVENAKAVIDLYLVEEAKRTFDPDELDTGDIRPKVTVDQAIRISQRSASRARKAVTEPDPFDEEDEGGAGDDEELQAVKNSIFGKLRRMREADEREQLKLGWTRDESFEVMIPPGYLKGPDYRPKPPELPVDYYSNYRGKGPGPS